MSRDRQSEMVPETLSRRNVLQQVAGLGVISAVGVARSRAGGKSEQTDSQESTTVDDETGPEHTTITDWHDLDAVRNDLSGDYVLGNDLDSATAGYDDHVGNPSAGWDPIGDFDNGFLGTFDGNGHEIADLVIDRQGETDVGLFGGATFATLENIEFRNAEIAGSDRVGILAGSTSQTTVKQVHAEGEVTGEGGVGVGGLIGSHDGETLNSSARGTVNDVGGDGAFNLGGLVGQHDGTLKQSFADVTVNAGSTSQVGALVGQVSARSEDATVADSYATGDVTADSFVGGLIGVNSADNGVNAVVKRSYATGEVTGNTTTGGVVGSNGSIVEDSYWDTVSTGQSSGIGSGSGDVTGLETAEMQGSQAETNMGALDFDTIWRVETDPPDYPALQWETSINPTEYRVGDVDMDGEVDIVDVVRIQRHLAQLDPDPFAEELADVRRTGEITIVDAVLIQQWLAEIRDPRYVEVTDLSADQSMVYADLTNTGGLGAWDEAELAITPQTAEATRIIEGYEAGDPVDLGEILPASTVKTAIFDTAPDGGQDSLEFDISDLSSGTYVGVVQTGDDSDQITFTV